MSKTATKNEFIENVEFPTFDASKATDQLRSFAEKGVEQSKEVYSKLKTGAETTQKAMEIDLRDRQDRRQRPVAEDDRRAAHQCRGELLSSRGAGWREVGF